MPHTHSDKLFEREHLPVPRENHIAPLDAPAQSPPPLQMKASKLKEDENAVVQKKEENQRQHAEKPGANPPPFTPPAENPVDQRGAGAGAGTGGKLMGKMEAAFGTSFSDVKIHQNSKQAETIQAKAFAKGNEVHFAPGQYNPESQSGQELMGHELAHVVQQRQGRVQANAVHAKGLAVNDDKGLENEADQMGRLAAGGQKVSARMRGTSAGAGANVVQGAFTSSVSLSRKLKEGEKENKVSASGISVTGIAIPEKKRQPTRFGIKQGHHTVAWTFMVKAFQQIGQKKLSGEDFIEKHLAVQYEGLKKQFSYSNDPQPINLELIKGFAKDQRTPSEWRKLISNLTQNYIRLHQLAPYSTAAKHFAKPGGEGATKNYLDEMEGGKIQNDSINIPSEDIGNTFNIKDVLKKLSGALEDIEVMLLDGDFINDPFTALQFIKQNWLNTLKNAYPVLWEKMEKEDQNLSTTIEQFFKDQYLYNAFARLGLFSFKGRTQTTNHNGKKVKDPEYSKQESLGSNMVPSTKTVKIDETVKIMDKIRPNYEDDFENETTKEIPNEKALKLVLNKELAKIPIPELVSKISELYFDKDQKLNKDPQINPDAKKIEGEDQLDESSFLQNLKSEYNVNVSISETNGVKSKMDAYTLNTVLMSNDRPDTQYGTTQLSHTVAWALIRESYETLSVGGKSLKEFLEIIQKDGLKLLGALSELKRMASNAEKKIDTDVKDPLIKLVTEIETEIKSDQERHDTGWEQIASDFLTRYVTIMHTAPTTTYGVKPGGRGEADAMYNLNTFESEISDDIPKLPKLTMVKEHLDKLIDLKYGSFFEEFKDKPFVYVVYEFETHIERAFPAVFKTFKKDIQQYSESKLSPLKSVNGYSSPKDYLDELRSGSSIEALKKTFIPEPEKKENPIEEIELLDNQDIDEQLPPFSPSPKDVRTNDPMEESSEHEEELQSENEEEEEESDSEVHEQIFKNQMTAPGKGKRTNDVLKSGGDNLSSHQGNDKKSKKKKKEEEKQKKKQKLLVLQSQDFSFHINSNHNQDKDGNGSGGGIEIEK